MASQCPHRQARVAAVDMTTSPPPVQVVTTATPTNFSTNVIQMMSLLNPFRSQKNPDPAPTPTYSAPASQDF